MTKFETTTVVQGPDFSASLYAGNIGELEWAARNEGRVDGKRQFAVMVYGRVSTPTETIRGKVTTTDLESAVRRLYAKALADLAEVIATPEAELRRLGLLVGNASQ